MHGKICYIEIPANDPADSAKFYGDIFGWQVRSRGDGALAFDDAGGVSGTWVGQKDRTPGETMRTYIMVDDIDATMKQIERAGGRITTPKTAIPGGAWFSAFVDPAGVELGLYQDQKQGI
jgi:predicted enzyme related to lactoylglutathione lyase